MSHAATRARLLRPEGYGQMNRNRSRVYFVRPPAHTSRAHAACLVIDMFPDDDALHAVFERYLEWWAWGRRPAHTNATLLRLDTLCERMFRAVEQVHSCVACVMRVACVTLV